jgi:hypothetical protein
MVSMKGAQTDGSQAGLNRFGHIIYDAPETGIMVMPARSDAPEHQGAD